MTEEENLTENLGGYRAHPAIANSDLKYIDSPRRFNLNKTRQLTEESTSWQKAGSLIDDYLLDPETFNEKYILEEEIEFTPSSPNQHSFVEQIMLNEDPLSVEDEKIFEAYANSYSKPSEKTALKLYSDLEAYFSFQMATVGKTIYSSEDSGMLYEIEKNCKNHMMLNRFLYESWKADQVFKHLQIIGMPKWGIEWKGEIDILIVNHDNKIIHNIDLKSTSKFISGFKWQYWNYRYYRQQALYRHLILWWLVQQNIIPEDYSEWTVSTGCMVVETVPIHEVAYIPVPESVLECGDELLKESAEKILFYRENGWENTQSYIQNNGREVVDWSDLVT